MGKTPTILQIVRGNPGKRLSTKQLKDKLQQEPTPMLLDGPVAAPKWLSDAAKEEWGEQIAYLTGNGVIGKNELSILLQYCQLYGEYILDAKAHRQVNAALIAQMRALRADLGIGPSVRSKFVKGNKSEPTNSWEALK